MSHNGIFLMFFDIFPILKQIYSKIICKLKNNAYLCTRLTADRLTR